MKRKEEKLKRKLRVLKILELVRKKKQKAGEVTDEKTRERLGRRVRRCKHRCRGAGDQAWRWHWSGNSLQWGRSSVAGSWGTSGIKMGKCAIIYLGNRGNGVLGEQAGLIWGKKDILNRS